MIAVEARNVDVIFQAENRLVKALNNLTLQVTAGSWLSIIGKNGSGKSTLARVLAQLMPVSRGELFIMEKRVKAGGGNKQEGPLRKLHKTRTPDVQMVFQNPEAGLVGETVFEDVAFGLSLLQVPVSEMREAVHQALLPFGLHRWMDKPVANLSGGQKQLLCIASCFAMNPAVFIFDECTSMLDESARQTVRHAVKKLQASGKTIIWLTQHLEELEDADTVVALEDGQIRYQGDARSFFYETPDTSQNNSWCRALNFTPPYIVQVAEHLRLRQNLSWFKPISAKELLEWRNTSCLSN